MLNCLLKWSYVKMYVYIHVYLVAIHMWLPVYTLFSGLISNIGNYIVVGVLYLAQHQKAHPLHVKVFAMICWESFRHIYIHTGDCFVVVCVYISQYCWG